MRQRLARPAVGLLLVGLLVSCASGDGSRAGTAPTRDRTAAVEGPSTPATEISPTPDPHTSLIATATVADVEVFASASGAGAPVHVLAHPTDVGAPRVFLVEERRDDWLRVLLPVRPNGSTGWVRADDVELTRTRYRVHVDLAAFELTVHDGDELVVEASIGYGAEDTPTPGGDYYVTELLQPPDPTGLYGPYAFGLSGFSDVHLDFAGGEGVIGIHGTNDPDSIGRRVSNGCIRVDNEIIVELASRLPLGTPVAVTA